MYIYYFCLVRFKNSTGGNHIIFEIISAYLNTYYKTDVG